MKASCNYFSSALIFQAHFIASRVAIITTADARVVVFAVGDVIDLIVTFPPTKVVMEAKYAEQVPEFAFRMFTRLNLAYHGAIRKSSRSSNFARES